MNPPEPMDRRPAICSKSYLKPREACDEILHDCSLGLWTRIKFSKMGQKSSVLILFVG